MKVGSHYEIDKISRSHFVETFDACGVNVKVLNGIFEKFSERTKMVESVLEGDTVAKSNPKLTEKITARLKTIAEKMH